MFTFLLGAVAGGLAAIYWLGGLGSLGERHMPRLRDQAADKVEAAERAVVRIVRNASMKARAGLKPEQTQSEERNN